MHESGQLHESCQQCQTKLYRSLKAQKLVSSSHLAAKHPRTTPDCSKFTLNPELLVLL